MKKIVCCVIFIFFFYGCGTLGYEFVKGARPYEITVKAAPGRFQEIAGRVLADFGYRIEEEKAVYLLASSDERDAHIYMEWFQVNDKEVRASIWRIRYKMRSLSLDSQLGHDYEKLQPDSEIHQIGKKIKELSKSPSF
ncbi:MAG: hypothetical protein JW928_04655 [Candidatus Aureabacteria bacterium]|nr:hypothetical protein [Candidatus Auribacterota bacterium]